MIEPLETRIAPANAAVIELSALNGTDGFQISGEVAGDYSGRSLSAAGDINGDGIGDLVVGADLAAASGPQSGASYVIFGTTGAFPANLLLSSLNGSNGFQISGEAIGDNSGRAVGAAGDVNGDGFDDLIIGAPNADPSGRSGAGAVYVIFGKNTGFAANLNLSTLDGSNGFKIIGAANGDATGIAVGAAGDVNGDGFADIIIGADHATGDAANSGASYVVFGHTGMFGATLDLAALTGGNGFKIAGVATGDAFGHSVSGAGDVNGDGFDDVIIGAFHATGNVADSGASYLVFGRGTPFAASLSAAALGGGDGFKLSGVIAGDYTGYSVSGAGDVNGDAFDDVIVGAVFADPNGVKSGTSYVVYGKASGFAANIDLATLDGTTGSNINGEAVMDFVGTSVSGAGDVNGDGFDDLHIGANGLDTHGTYTGASYVVFGRAGGFGTNFEVSTLDGTNGFQINGETGGHFAGSSVSAAGDVNDDGFADVFIAARFADSIAGATYVVFGKGTTVDPTLSADGRTATYIDVDGDRVTVKTSTGDLTGKLGLLAFGAGARLTTVDLTDAQFDGASLSIKAKKSATGDGLVNVGRIDATGRDLGKVTVKGDLASIDCGNGDFSDPALALLSVRSMGRFGLTTGSPDLQSDIMGTLGTLKVAGDIHGATISASGAENGKINSVIIRGSLIGGTADGSGGLTASGEIGKVKIGRDFRGGSGENAGIIFSQGTIGSITIAGSLVGAVGEASARITSLGDMGAVKIRGDMIGGEGELSGTIDSSGELASLTIGGSMIGGNGDNILSEPMLFREGQVFAIGSIGPVKIAGDLLGGGGYGTGQVRSDADIESVTIGGSMIGGTGLAGGHICSEGDLGPVKIAGDVIGSVNFYTGFIESFRKIDSVTIGGSMIGGAGGISGAIGASTDVGPVKIGGDVRGSSISGTDLDLGYTGTIYGARITSVFVAGSLISGIDQSVSGRLYQNGSIYAGQDLGKVVIKGSLIGHSTPNGDSPVVIAGRGQQTLAPGATSDVAIASVKIGGNVELAQILGGYLQGFASDVPFNGNASIGPVKVGGDWIASSISAGVQDGGAPGFGTPGDTIIAGATLISRIASIAIKGAVIGSAADGDHFGFTAQQIGSFKAGPFRAVLSSGTDAPIALSPHTGDVTIREV